MRLEKENKSFARKPPKFDPALGVAFSYGSLFGVAILLFILLLFSASEGTEPSPFALWLSYLNHCPSVPLPRRPAVIASELFLLLNIGISDRMYQTEPERRACERKSGPIHHQGRPEVPLRQARLQPERPLNLHVADIARGSDALSQD